MVGGERKRPVNEIVRVDATSAVHPMDLMAVLDAVLTIKLNWLQLSSVRLPSASRVK